MPRIKEGEFELPKDVLPCHYGFNPSIGPRKIPPNTPGGHWEWVPDKHPEILPQKKDPKKKK